MDTKSRKLLRRAAGMMACAALAGTMDVTAAAANGIGQIDTAKLLDIHEKADESSAVLGQVMDEGHVAILDRADGWVCIMAGEIIGWVPQVNLIETEVSFEEAHEANQKVIAEITEELENIEEKAEETEESKQAAGENAQTQETLPPETAQLPAEIVDTASVQEELSAAQEAAPPVWEISAVSAEDIELLANIIYCEAASEPYIGKVAVGNVVINRVKSGQYPSTIRDVIYEKGQFSPVRSGRMEKALRNASADIFCYQAAVEALAGSRPIEDKLHFRRVNGRSGQVIGNHVFY